MPSKKSRSSRSSLSLWREERGCSEAALSRLAVELARELSSGSRVLLEGPLGAGKTTFARALLSALGVTQPPEGSPTFAIAHEYESPKGGVVHADLYRIRHESEIAEAGIEAALWERETIGILEWVSNWPGFEQAILKEGYAWKVTLSFSENQDRRDVRIERV